MGLSFVISGGQVLIRSQVFISVLTVS